MVWTNDDSDDICRCIRETLGGSVKCPRLYGLFPASGRYLAHRHCLAVTHPLQPPAPKSLLPADLDSGGVKSRRKTPNVPAGASDPAQQARRVLAAAPPQRRKGWPEYNARRKEVPRVSGHVEVSRGRRGAGSASSASSPAGSPAAPHSLGPAKSVPGRWPRPTQGGAVRLGVAVVPGGSELAIGGPGKR